MNAPDRGRAAIYTLGCRLNQAESALLAGRLEEAGYELVPFDGPADVGIVHTCTVTAEADAKSRKAVRAFLRRNPDAFAAAIGCYAHADAAALAKVKGLDLIADNGAKFDWLALIGQGKRPEPLVLLTEFDAAPFAVPRAGRTPIRRRVNLKIQEGCDNACSYCRVPRVRGPARSRVFDDLVAEARGLAARGAKELVLTGVNTGSYAHAGKSLLDVLDALNAIDGLARLRVSSIELSYVGDALFDRMAAPDHRLQPFLHIPLQSGCDATLARMNRPYAASAFRAAADRICARVPGAAVGTDVLVGTPGETPAEFETTLDLLDACPLAYCHVFKYSERPGTRAAAMPGSVEPGERNRRSRLVRALSARKHDVFRARLIGQRVDVLFESQGPGGWTGYTGNYVRAAACSETDLTNTVRAVHLRRVDRGVIRGELIDE